METEIIPAKELEIYKQQLDDADKFSRSLEVKTESDYQDATVEAKAIKDRLELVVKRKEEMTKPLNVTLKSIRDLFKPMETSLEGALGIVKTKMLSYTNEKERKASEDKAKIDARVEKGTLKQGTAEVKKFIIDNSIQKTVSAEGGSATTKKVKKYYVTDLSKVPLDFLEVDMVKVKASFKSGFPVPGVDERIENELSIK